MKIGVSGDIGSFSEEAGQIYAARNSIEDYQISYLIDMDGVLSALNRGEIDIGIFPVVNNNSGLVYPAFQAMGRYLFNIIDEVHLSVSQCLLAKKFMPLNEIKAIYSYTPAFVQCKNFLASIKDMVTIDWGDTAKAARDLANGAIDANCAVIASSNAAKAYDLQIIASDIQDVKPNITMFVVVEKL